MIETAVDKLFGEFLRGANIRQSNFGTHLSRVLGRKPTVKEKRRAEDMFYHKLLKHHGLGEAFSFLPTKKEAEEFAEKLIKHGAVGVRIGRKTSAGYPVFSALPLNILREFKEKYEREMKEKARKAIAEAKEVYEGEPTDEPVLDIVAKYEAYGIEPRLTKEEVLRIARSELEKYGLNDVEVKISKYHGRDPVAPYADATTFYRRGKFKIHLHPILQYVDEVGVREAIRHEVEKHILEGIK